MKALRLVFVAGAVAIAIACGPGFLDGISGGVRPAGEAGAEAGPTCDSHQPPPAPDADDKGPNITVSVFALEAIRIDTASDAGIAPPVSLDLDHTCTTAHGKDSCIRPGDGGVLVDGPRGEDNALGALFDAIDESGDFFPPTFATDRIKSGYFTLMVGLAGWNGTPNDPRVSVVLYDSEGVTKTDADGGRRRPRFDGTDVWSVDPNSIISGFNHLGVDCNSDQAKYNCIARIRDDLAYVKDGQLVAHPRRDDALDGPVEIGLRSVVGEIALNFFDLTLIAKLTGGPDGPYRLAGEFSGRIPATNLIQTFGGIEDFTSNTGGPICKNTVLFALSRNAVCAAQDLASPGKDNTGAKCRYVSGAFSFTAGQALLGEVFDNGQIDGGCDDTTVYDCP